MKIVFIILLASMLIALGYRIGRESKSNAKFKRKVVDCFSDVDWSPNSFVTSGVALENKQGEKLFYRIPPIDEAIKKVNDLLVNE